MATIFLLSAAAFMLTIADAIRNPLRYLLLLGGIGMFALAILIGTLIEIANSSANIHRFEPTQAVYCSVAGIALPAGASLEVKLYRGNTHVKTERRVTVAGNQWYAFLLAEAQTLPEGTYRVEVLLDGELVKTNQFEIKASR